MSKPKYYAVRRGRVPGIYMTWAECERQVKGYPKQAYKGFTTLEDAEAYLHDACTTKEEQPKETATVSTRAPGENHYDIYTDGSYEKGKYSWAFVVYKGGILVHTSASLGTNLKALSTRNVVGELEAVINAIKWAIIQGATSANSKLTVTIHHDYTGPAEWASGNWKTNTEITRAYVEFIKPCLDWVSFEKVRAHSGVEGNELADKLAGEALLS